VAAGFLAAAAPDLDFVVGFFGPLEYMMYHRGVTHSLILLPLWALLLSPLLAWILREPGGWRALYGVSVLSLGIHVAGDVITTYGTMIFAPFSDWRAAIGTTFIIDLWFSGIILAGLAAATILYRFRWPAIAASAVLVAYVGFQYLQKKTAFEVGEQYARAQGLSHATVAVHPRPVSPFNWTVFASDAEVHHFAHVNLMRKAPRAVHQDDGFIARLDAVYQPLSAVRWEARARYGEGVVKPLAQEAWNSPAMAPYRWFADQPAFDGVSVGSTCAWFVDLRFLTPGRDAMPFRYGACRNQPGSPWRLVPPA
jgi:inner membrane protein